LKKENNDWMWKYESRDAELGTEYMLKYTKQGDYPLDKENVWPYIIGYESTTVLI
jgi:hypothetical protein